MADEAQDTNKTVQQPRGNEKRGDAHPKSPADHAPAAPGETKQLDPFYKDTVHVAAER